jgi:hypothetical protein
MPNMHNRPNYFWTGLIMPKYVKTLIDMVGVAEKSQLIRPVMQYLGLVLLCVQTIAIILGINNHF